MISDTARPRRVLVVDDECDAAETLGDSLARNGFACEVALSGAAALSATAKQRFDVVVSDVQMAGMSGLELLERLTAAHPALPVILVTGFSKLADAVEATKRGAFQYVAKPYDLGDLMDIVAQALAPEADLGETRPSQAVAPRRRPGALSLTRSGREPEPLLGESGAMVRLGNAIDHVAGSRAPVLILGESGSGKDLVAHHIHARGPRSDRPFVAVNVSAIPEQLLESEMFGHVRGAFTGAAESRRGLFADADGGTLFLDEIGEMSITLQAKLLRVLQFGEVRSIGSDTVRTVDVRIIAATHRDLSSLVASGHFREDLYYRLNVLPLAVPALRDRAVDIDLLLNHFLSQALARTPRSCVREIDKEARASLAKERWPGNVRELASAVERLVVFGSAPSVGVDELSRISKGEQEESARGRELGTLRQVSEHHVARVLAKTGGNRPRAAEILGVNLSTLYRWRARAGD